MNLLKHKDIHVTNITAICAGWTMEMQAPLGCTLIIAPQQSQYVYLRFLRKAEHNSVPELYTSLAFRKILLYTHAHSDTQLEDQLTEDDIRFLNNGPQDIRMEAFSFGSSLSENDTRLLFDSHASWKTHVLHRQFPEINARELQAAHCLFTTDDVAISVGWKVLLKEVGTSGTEASGSNYVLGLQLANSPPPVPFSLLRTALLDLKKRSLNIGVKLPRQTLIEGYLHHYNSVQGRNGRRSFIIVSLIFEQLLDLQIYPKG